MYTLHYAPDNASLIHNLAIACERDGDSTRAARFWSFSARISAGRPSATPASAL